MNESQGPVVRFGKRKLTTEAYRIQTALKDKTTASGVTFGKRKGGDARAAVKPKLDETPPEPLALAQLEKLLEEDPGALDDAIKIEVRDSKPRTGALRLFREAEEAREGGARPEVLAMLEHFAKGKGK